MWRIPVTREDFKREKRDASHRLGCTIYIVMQFPIRKRQRNFNSFSVNNKADNRLSFKNDWYILYFSPFFWWLEFRWFI
jgi:hypothetical protein